MIPLLDLPGRQVNGPWVYPCWTFLASRSMALGFHREHKEELKTETFYLCQGGADKEEEEVELNKYKSQEEKIRYVRMERMEEGH